MINEAKEGLEELLRYNDAVREQEENIQLQEEDWGKNELFRKAQEKVEGKN